MAVNEITKNFLVYAIRDFFIRGGSCHAVLKYVSPKKFIIQTFFSIQSKGEILSSLVLKNIPSISSKNTICISKAPFPYTTTMRFFI